jgi:hypothetical protein
MKPSPSEAGQVTKGKKEVDPNYFNKANSNPGYPTNLTSELANENEKLNLKI